MSRTAQHANAKNRWRWNKKRDAWQMWESRREPSRLSKLILEGICEFEDTATVSLRCLNYIASAHLHVWDAASDRRKMRRRASDRFATRPDSRRCRDRRALYFQSLEVDPEGTCPGCIMGHGYVHHCGGDM